MALWDLILRMGMDTTGVTLAEKKVDSSMKSLGKQINSYLKKAFTFYAIEQTFRRTIMMADELNDKAEQYQTTVENIQKIQNSARAYGVPEDKLLDAGNRYTTAMSKAMGGDTEMLKRFALLKLELKDTTKEGFDLAKAMESVGLAMKGIKLSGEQIAAFNAIFGRNSVKMLPAMRAASSSGSALDISGAEAENLGATADTVMAFFRKLPLKIAATLAGGFGEMGRMSVSMFHDQLPDGVKKKIMAEMGTDKGIDPEQELYGIELRKTIAKEDKERAIAEEKLLKEKQKAAQAIFNRRPDAETMFDSLNQIGGFAQQSRGMSGVQSESVRLLGAIKDATEQIAREGL